MSNETLIILGYSFVICFGISVFIISIKLIERVMFVFDCLEKHRDQMDALDWRIGLLSDRIDRTQKWSIKTKRELESAIKSRNSGRNTATKNNKS